MRKFSKISLSVILTASPSPVTFEAIALNSSPVPPDHGKLQPVFALEVKEHRHRHAQHEEQDEGVAP